MDLREGVGRAALVLGGISGVFGLLLGAFTFFDNPSDLSGKALVYTSLLLPILFFLVPWAIVKGIGWIVQGFKGN